MVPVGGVTRSSPRERTKAATLAEYDAAMAAALANVAPVNPKPKRKRRTKEEMKVVRAHAAARIAAARDRAEPDWLRDQDEDEREFLARLHGSAET